MKRSLEFEPVCPMCEKAVNPMAISVATDQEAEFRALADLMKDSDPVNEEEEESGGIV
jgi:hypothetical protein